MLQYSNTEAYRLIVLNDATCGDNKYLHVAKIEQPFDQCLDRFQLFDFFNLYVVI